MSKAKSSIVKTSATFDPFKFNWRSYDSWVYWGDRYSGWMMVTAIAFSILGLVLAIIGSIAAAVVASNNMHLEIVKQVALAVARAHH